MEERYGERPLQEEGIVYSDYMGSGLGNKPSHGGHGYKAEAMFGLLPGCPELEHDLNLQGTPPRIFKVESSSAHNFTLFTNSALVCCVCLSCVGIGLKAGVVVVGSGGSGGGSGSGGSADAGGSRAKRKITKRTRKRMLCPLDPRPRGLPSLALPPTAIQTPKFVYSRIVLGGKCFDKS
ncbi:hypothetical protein M0802_002930 [Mischocyttarus mexicanus]|nr:hypothetical protein M0802_002930 [Mischocyttarus mexicanus]